MRLECLQKETRGRGKSGAILGGKATDIDKITVWSGGATRVDVLCCNAYWWCATVRHAERWGRDLWRWLVLQRA